MLDPTQSGQPLTAVRNVLLKPFRPGQFFSDVTAAGVKFGITREEVVNRIVAAAEQHFAGMRRIKPLCVLRIHSIRCSLCYIAVA